LAKLLISHGDTDHAGGFYGLVNSIEINQALLAPDFFRAHRPAITMPVTVEQCIRGEGLEMVFF
jgi:beta-lactamase superfamily II metal-dependent hydrolase